MARLIHLCAAAALILSSARATAQPVRDTVVVVGAARTLTTSFHGRPMIEPHIAAHPEEASRLLVAAMVAEPASEWESMRSTLRCVLFLSTDAGATWHERDMGVTTCYDPWVVFTAAGTAVFSALASHPSLPHQEEGLLVFTSRDRGASWAQPPVGLGVQHDRPMMVAGGTTTVNADWLYLVSSRTIRGEHGAVREAVYVTRSRNGGRTFDEPRVLTPNNLVLRAEPPVVHRDGTLVVQYVEAGYASAGPRPQVQFDRRRAWTLQSHDGGVSFSAPRFVTDACGPPRFATAAMVLHGEPERMTHFCNAAGGGAVVAVTAAVQSELWGAPVPIHPALPAGHTALIRAAAAGADGTIGVIYTTRHTEGDQPCYQVFFTASVSSGAGFLPPQSLGPAACLDRSANGATLNSWPDGGDYYGLAAAADGRFHAAWPDSRSGVFQISATIIDVTIR